MIHRPFEYSAAEVTPFTTSIGGIPQTVYQMPFHNPGKDPLHNIPQLDLNEILVKVIIGPCAYPETVYRTLVDEMTAAGIQNARSRVIKSDIPLRQQVSF